MADERENPDFVRALWTAVLARAVEDYRYKGRIKESKAYRKDAKKWIEGTDYKGVGSFAYVCEAIDLDPDAVRDNLKNRMPDNE